jgi:hypothetical protein
MNGRMSAIGPKRTSLVAPHMSAFGGKPDIALGSPATWLLTQVTSALCPRLQLQASPILLHFSVEP